MSSEEDSDHEINSKKHDQLLSLCKETSGKKGSKAVARKEPSLKVGEFNLTKKIHNAKTNTNIMKIKNDKSSKVKKSKKEKLKLDAPLEDFQQKKIKRAVGFEKIKSNLSKWDPIVFHNRVAEHLHFPLDKEEITIKDSRKLFSNFQTTSDLEARFTDLTQGENNEPIEENKTIKQTLSWREIRKKRGEMAKLRAIQSYEESKARRQGKIKSKNYHRLAKREKVNGVLKNWDKLKQDNPEAALEQFKQFELARVKERMTLRHRSGGKWVHNLAIRAKFSKESRQALAEQHRLSQSLTKKTLPDSVIEDEDEDEDFQNLSEGEINEENNLALPSSNSQPAAEEIRLDALQPLIMIDSGIPEIVDAHYMDEESTDIMPVINEDDDANEEFRKEREELINQSQTKSVDLAMPGWGCWGSKDLKVPKKQKSRLILKFPKQIHQKSDQLILNDDKIKSIATHQVDDLPFPFKRVADFESNIRAPLGRDFVPQTAHKKLIKPNVETKLGTIINPMDSDMIVNLMDTFNNSKLKSTKGNKKKKTPFSKKK